MIELNLVPDVKQDLIRARKVRNLVVSGAIIAGLVSLGLVILLSVYLFGVQVLRSTLANNAITQKSQELKQVPDLANMLTIQSQLANISKYHDDKNIDSRLLDLIIAINPVKPNQVTFSDVRIDSETKTIRIDAQAANGFVAADVFKKTVQATTLKYDMDGESKTEPLAKTISLSDLSYGEDSTGAKVLRFSIDFEYTDALFARNSSNLIITRPDRQNATDSFKYVPESIFGDRVNEAGGAQ